MAGPKASVGGFVKIAGGSGVMLPSCTLKNPLTTETDGCVSCHGVPEGSGLPAASTIRNAIEKAPFLGNPAASVRRPWYVSRSGALCAKILNES
jgi:hypothetical protein